MRKPVAMAFNPKEWLIGAGRAAARIQIRTLPKVTLMGNLRRH